MIGFGKIVTIVAPARQQAEVQPYIGHARLGLHKYEAQQRTRQLDCVYFSQRGFHSDVKPGAVFTLLTKAEDP